MSQNFVRAAAPELGRHIYIHPKNSSMLQASYGRIRLAPAMKRVEFVDPKQETGLICLEGQCSIQAGKDHFSLSPNDALYVPKGCPVVIETASTVDLVEFSAPVDGEYPLQFIPYADLQANPKLHFTSGTPGAQREINIHFGTNIQAGRLVAGITRSHPGNWTSWPPHEHAKMLEEIYVYVDMPAPAYGLQLVYTDEITPAQVDVVRENDAVLLPAGYHPNVAIPGSKLNFVWIMAAHREVEDRQWGVVQVDPNFA